MALFKSVVGQAKVLAPRVAGARWFRISASHHQSQVNIVKSKSPDLNIPRQHFFDFLWQDSLARWGDKTALVSGATKESFTYQESVLESKKAALGLAESFQPQKGDVLALMMPNSPEYIFVLSGASMLGVPVTTVNPSYTAPDVARQFQMSKTKMAVTTEALLPVVLEAVKLAKADIKVISLDAKSSSSQVKAFNELRQNNGDIDKVDGIDVDNDVLVLPFSSGTSGLPKGVMLTHTNIISNMSQLLFSKGFDYMKMPTESFQPSIVGVLPFFHIFGLVGSLFNTLQGGGKVITLPGFDPEGFITALATYKPNFLHLVPPLVGFCATVPAVKPELLTQVDNVLVGAAPVGKALIQKFKEKAPTVKFREAWGMTELSPAATVTPDNDLVDGSCGVCLANTWAKVVSLETGQALGPGETGELCVKGPQVMKGYLDNEQATKDCIKDGWLHSGDIAYYDETGHFFIVDRLKELIKVKGLQVAPAELENLLRLHPDIADNAVIGVPDERSGELPRAYVVKRNPDLTDTAIHAYVDERVTDFKRLKGGIEFVDVIPKSASGKILRRLLLDDFKNKN